MGGRAIDMAAVRARWRTIRGVFVDLDGTVYHGPELIPGADGALRRIAASGRQVLYVSNNASATLRSVVDKLRAFGLDVPDEAVITAVSVLAERLGQRPEARVLALCEEGARHEFEAAGARLLPRSLTERSQWPTGLGGYTERPSPGHVAMREAAAADIVAIGCHGDFGFHSVALALQALANGAQLMATDGDSTYPVPGGLLPGTGSLLA
ncbi:MAG TPA: hypothetical protein VFK80_02755, partial [Limnochordia bacterium]|nr:hypothetical protein [Limnochordia bacterium]